MASLIRFAELLLIYHVNYATLQRYEKQFPINDLMNIFNYNVYSLCEWEG